MREILTCPQQLNLFQFGISLTQMIPASEVSCRELSELEFISFQNRPIVRASVHLINAPLYCI